VSTPPPLAADPAPFRDAARAALLGVLVNLALGLVKLVVGLTQSSFALVADAVNSLGDTLTSIVVYFALRVSQRPPDAEHPYGHTKAEAIAASNVALVVLATGLWVGIEAVRRFPEDHAAPSLLVLFVAGANALIKEALFHYKRRVGHRVGSTALIANAWDHRADALCALAVLIGAGAILLGAPNWADDIAALVVVGAILAAGVALFRKAAHDLMDPVAEQEQVDAVRRSALAVEGVRALDRVILRKSGLVFFLDIHVQVDAEISVDEGHRIGHRVKDRLLSDLPRLADVLVHLEPFREE
jgi:cation diffusion facilitator family transporter